MSLSVLLTPKRQIQGKEQTWENISNKYESKGYCYEELTQTRKTQACLWGDEQGHK